MTKTYMSEMENDVKNIWYLITKDSNTWKQINTAPTINLSLIEACILKNIRSCIVSATKRANPNICDHMLIVSFVHHITLQ